MNRNQKIALGCGAAGCLGLILVVLVGGVVYFALRSTTSNSNRSRIITLNGNSSEGSDTTSNDSETANANISEETPSSSLSDDDKHKLFQAAAVTQDTILVQRVWRKLGLTKADGTPNDEYTQFMKDHVTWLFSNTDFIQTVNTPEKARAYVEEHLND
jgi:hypothetical protein